MSVKDEQDQSAFLFLSLSLPVPDGATLWLGELSAVDELARWDGAGPAAVLGARERLRAEQHVARQAGELDLRPDRPVVTGHAAACRSIVTRCCHQMLNLQIKLE